MTTFKLDDLYHMTAHIFSEQNADRPAAATFAHFVEVCGMLSIHDRRKRREGITVTDALCKALGWFFPLMAKFQVKSVEQLIFRKYPYACPYCRELPHRDAQCKVVKGTADTVNHPAVLQKFQENAHLRPKGLNDWQEMFARIYPRSAEERSGRSTIGLLEELGEMAEAVRVFERHPKYFAGEAADVFSYLMGIANEHALHLDQSEQKSFSFESEYLQRYPGLCVQCGYKICICPAIPASTVGRMAKELEVKNGGGNPFGFEPEAFEAEGKSVSERALARMGGYPQLAALPFDRGEVNSALIVLCLRLSDALETSDPAATSKLRSIALTAASSVSPAGSREHATEAVTRVLQDLRELSPQVHQQLVAAQPSEELAVQLGTLLTKKRVLLIFASPRTEDPLRLQEEERAIREAIKLSPNRDAIELKVLPAATVDDLRRELLSNEYDILHFSGHGSKDSSLAFEDALGGSVFASFSAIKDLIARYPSISCVILNACYSLKSLEALAPVTVGMEAEVGDAAAIEFARGFYDAIGANKSVDFAVEEGISAVQLKGLIDSLPLAIVKPRALT